MSDRISIALFDPIERRRAALCHRLTDSNLSVLPFERAGELKFMSHRKFAILVYDEFPFTDSLLENFHHLGIWAPIIAYSERPDPQRVAEVIFYGAVDYLSENFNKSQLMYSLAQVDVRSRVIRNAREAGHRALANLDLLTPREQDVLLAVADGFSNKIIAKRLGITSRTVECHRANALNKLGAKNSSEAVRIIFEAKFLSTKIPCR